MSYIFSIFIVENQRAIFDYAKTKIHDNPLWKWRENTQPNFALCTSFSSLYQQFNDGGLRYCVLQILSILIFLNGIFLYFSRS